MIKNEPNDGMAEPEELTLPSNVLSVEVKTKTGPKRVKLP